MKQNINLAAKNGSVERDGLESWANVDRWMKQNVRSSLSFHSLPNQVSILCASGCVWLYVCVRVFLLNLSWSAICKKSPCDLSFIINIAAC